MKILQVSNRDSPRMHIIHPTHKGTSLTTNAMKATMMKCQLLLFLILLLETAYSEGYTAFAYFGCSQSKSTPGSPYQSNLDSLLTSLANAATLSSYDAFTSSSASASYPAYGLFQCRSDLPSSSCASCARSALDRLSSLCPTSVGAAIQLKGCLLRFSDDPFLGKPDTSLLYKKCGSAVPAAEDGVALLGMRDATFAALSAGVGDYRVGGVGPVRALAQCVGDQSPQQCSDCVAAAIGHLKDGCGGADGGNAYLGKCFASYWSEADGSMTEGRIAVSGVTVTGGGWLLLTFAFLGLI